MKKKSNFIYSLVLPTRYFYGFKIGFERLEIELFTFDLTIIFLIFGISAAVVKNFFGIIFRPLFFTFIDFSKNLGLMSSSELVVD